MKKKTNKIELEDLKGSEGTEGTEGTEGVKGTQGNGEELEELRKKAAEYEAGWKRALADYENLKRDMSSQAAESRNRIKADFAHALLPVMDNFQQAVRSAPASEEIAEVVSPPGDPTSPGVTSAKAWLQGVLYIQKQFEGVLTDLGLEKIDSTGAFDPYLHEAVGEGEEQTEVRGGWKIGDHVIRPAHVILKRNST